MGPVRKHLGPTVYFPSSSPNQTHSKKVFVPSFFSKFFIYSISLPNKHTLREESENDPIKRLSTNLIIRYLENPPTHDKVKTNFDGFCLKIQMKHGLALWCVVARGSDDNFV